MNTFKLRLRLWVTRRIAETLAPISYTTDLIFGRETVITRIQRSAEIESVVLSGRLLIAIAENIFGATAPLAEDAEHEKGNT